MFEAHDNQSQSSLGLSFQEQQLLLSAQMFYGSTK